MENELLTKEFLEYIVQTLVENANDTLEELKENPNDVFYKGKKLAYYEMLDSIKNRLEVRDEDISNYGLDFDLDKVLA